MPIKTEPKPMDREVLSQAAAVLRFVAYDNRRLLARESQWLLQRIAYLLDGVELMQPLERKHFRNQDFVVMALLVEAHRAVKAEAEGFDHHKPWDNDDAS